MKNILIIFSICAFGSLFAAPTDTTAIYFSVSEINELSVSSTGVTMPSIDAITAGSDPDPVFNTSTSYSITTNGTNKKIIASIDAQSSEDLTLSLLINAPPSGTPLGQAQALQTTSQDFVTAITETVGSSLTLNYELAAGISVPAGFTDYYITTITLTDG